MRERRKIDDDENFRVGGLVVVVVVVDSVAVNIRKSLNFFTPFESSKLGGNYMILSSCSPHSRFTKEYICNLLLSLSLFSLYTRISRNK